MADTTNRDEYNVEVFTYGADEGFTNEPRVGLLRTTPEGVQILVTSEDGCEPPNSLEDPCIVGFYIDEALANGDCAEVYRRPPSARISLRAYGKNGVLPDEVAQTVRKLETIEFAKKNGFEVEGPLGFIRTVDDLGSQPPGLRERSDHWSLTVFIDTPDGFVPDLMSDPCDIGLYANSDDIGFPAEGCYSKSTVAEALLLYGKMGTGVEDHIDPVRRATVSFATDNGFERVGSNLGYMRTVETNDIGEVIIVIENDDGTRPADLSEKCNVIVCSHEVDENGEARENVNIRGITLACAIHRYGTNGFDIGEMLVDRQSNIDELKAKSDALAKLQTFLRAAADLAEVPKFNDVIGAGYPLEICFDEFVNDVSDWLSVARKGGAR